MEISVEEIIRIVTREVIAELAKRGITITGTDLKSGEKANSTSSSAIVLKSEKIDMSNYKSPILTERHVNNLNELVGEIIVPKGTVVTPKAKEAIKKRKLLIRFE